ncbi:MAG: type I-C CRISPR-associated protein Cas7/Csd2 [Thermomicrobiales bacterium]
MTDTAPTTTVATTPHLDAARRHDIVLLFDVVDGNPNGDPDAGNLPRIDPETSQGLVSDVSIKRKIRNFVDDTRGNEERFKIYVQDKGIALNNLHERAYTAKGIKSTGTKQKREEVSQARQWMCENFFDIRTFGAVMSTEVNAGQVRGPVQVTFARSVDPIVPLDLSITRVAITKEKDAEFVVGEDGKNTGGKVTEMGRKALVPYGLYRANIFISPQQAKETGFDNDDLAIIWDALQRMWDFDRSASRGMMACRGLYVFSHDNSYGNAPAHKLLERVTVNRKPDAIAPRAFTDYVVAVNDRDLPEGVTLTILEG